MNAIIFLADKNVITNIKDYKSNLIDVLVILEPTKDGIGWYNIFINMSNPIWQEHFQNTCQLGENNIDTVEFLVKGLMGLKITDVEICDMQTRFGKSFINKFNQVVKNVNPNLKINIIY